MTALDQAIAAAREALDTHRVNTSDYCVSVRYIDWAEIVERLLAALDAARGEAVWQYRATSQGQTWVDCRDEQIARTMKANGFEIRCLYAAPPAAVVPANVTPMRQPRADLARLVESINAAVYANGDGLSVTEAIGALELAKLELLKEQEQ